MILGLILYAFCKSGGASTLYVWKHLPPTTYHLHHHILPYFNYYIQFYSFIFFYYFYHITSGNRTLGLRIYWLGLQVYRSTAELRVSQLGTIATAFI